MESILESRNEYQVAKYRMETRAYKTLDVNLVHAKSDVIDKLMKGELKLKKTLGNLSFQLMVRLKKIGLKQ